MRQKKILYLFFYTFEYYIIIMCKKHTGQQHLFLFYFSFNTSNFKREFSPSFLNKIEKDF